MDPITMQHQSVFEGLKPEDVESSTPINKSHVLFVPKRSNLSNSKRTKFIVITKAIDLMDDEISLDESNIN